MSSRTNSIFIFFSDRDSHDRIIDFIKSTCFAIFLRDSRRKLYFICLGMLIIYREAISNFVTHEVGQARFKLTMNRDRVRFLSFWLRCYYMVV